MLSHVRDESQSAIMTHEPTEILELNEPAPPERGRPLVRILLDTWIPNARSRAGLPAAAPNLALVAIIAVGLLTGIAAGMLLV